MSIFNPFDSRFFGVKEFDVVSLTGSLYDMHQYTCCPVCANYGGFTDPVVVIELGKDLARRRGIVSSAVGISDQAERYFLGRSIQEGA